MNIDDLIIHESSRQGIYQSLARCFRLPDKDLIDTLKLLEFRMMCLGTEALPYVILMSGSYRLPENQQSIQIDFSKLFAGPYCLLAPPYGSVYLDGKRQLMGESTMEVVRCYHQAGLDVSEAFKEPPDHIAAELEFMYFLVFKEIEALQNGDKRVFLKKLSDQRAFLNSHLSPWVAEFTGLVKKNAQHEFYVNLATATRIFLAEDAGELNLTVDSATEWEWDHAVP